MDRFRKGRTVSSSPYKKGRTVSSGPFQKGRTVLKKGADRFKNTFDIAVSNTFDIAVSKVFEDSHLKLLKMKGIPL